MSKFKEGDWVWSKSRECWEEIDRIGWSGFVYTKDGYIHIAWDDLLTVAEARDYRIPKPPKDTCGKRSSTSQESTPQGLDVPGVEHVRIVPRATI
jgi:hypothetical protein